MSKQREKKQRKDAWNNKEADKENLYSDLQKRSDQRDKEHEKKSKWEYSREKYRRKKKVAKDKGFKSLSRLGEE